MLPLSTNYAISKEDWFCGNDNFMTDLSYRSMRGSCHIYAADVNHCCAYHDECYSLQLGKSKCDDDFCRCLQSISDSFPAICEFFIMGKCDLVKTFADSNYRNSRKSKPKTISRLVPDDDELRDGIHDLYDACPWIGKIIKSCVLLYNFCIDGNSDKELCSANLRRCTKEASDFHSDDKCSAAVERLFPGAGNLIYNFGSSRQAVVALKPYIYRTLIIVGLLIISLCFMSTIVACVMFCTKDPDIDGALKGVKRVPEWLAFEKEFSSRKTDRKEQNKKKIKQSKLTRNLN
ncbi:unnamed protein product [Cylicocyclus nassatus]|uniref:Phospholipase A(2) n=1 Tax=Cylicocyclus nassatus TaxID=53992 RepID=A0AA36HAB7_CYLNA|nr:unnamed protein product [Cylicocyclus nassatus]